MKKIIFSILVVFVTFLIYYFNINKKIYYASIGDYLSNGINNLNTVNNGYSNNIKDYYGNNIEKYVNYSHIDDYRVMDLINDIKYNNTFEYENTEYYIQNLLIKANLMTISIGMNDLIYRKNIDYDYVDNLLDDIDYLLELIRKYNKDDIYFLGFYDIINNREIIEYSNKKLNSICKKNNINFINIDKLNNYIIKGMYPTGDGYVYISNQILNFTK